MTTRSINSEGDRASLLRLLGGRKVPVTATVVKGRNRSLKQNKLTFKWYGEIAEQLSDRTPEEVYAYCKLHFGVPILRSDNEAWRLAYDRRVKPMDYETKLDLMGPLDLPVTRIMTTGQLARYLDAIALCFSAQGVALTDPDDIRKAA